MDVVGTPDRIAHVGQFGAIGVLGEVLIPGNQGERIVRRGIGDGKEMFGGDGSQSRLTRTRFELFRDKFWARQGNALNGQAAEATEILKTNHL